VGDLLDDLQQALVRAGAVKITPDGIEPLDVPEGQTKQTTELTDEP
jgi:cystathionine beta-lyase